MDSASADRTVVLESRELFLRGTRAGIFLGEIVHRSLHFSWRDLCSPVELPPDWTYSVSGGDPRLDPTGTRPVEWSPRRTQSE